MTSPNLHRGYLHVPGHCPSGVLLTVVFVACGCGQGHVGKNVKPAPLSSGARTAVVAAEGRVVSASRDETSQSGAVPGCPKRIVAIPGKAQVSLSWGAPDEAGDAPLVDYIVEYNVKQDGKWVSWKRFERDASTACAAVLTDLANGKEHAFRIAAVNRHGVGEFARLVPNVTPAERVAPMAPVKLKAFSERGRVTLVWDAPEDDGGSPVTNYEILYNTKVDGQWQAWRTFDRKDSAATEAEINGLIPGSEYAFQIVAVNEFGRSQPARLAPNVKLSGD